MTHSDEAMSYRALAGRHVSRRRVIALFGPYWPRLAVVPGLIGLASVAGLAEPFIIRHVIDEALPKGDFRLLTYLTIALVGIAAFTAIIGVLQTFISLKVGQAIMHELRVRVYAHLQSLPLFFFTSTRTGEVQSRIASDISGLQALVTHTVVELAKDVSLAFMTVVAMLVLDWRLALFSLVVVPLLIWLQRRVGSLREAITHEQQVRIADMSSTIQESLSISGIVLTRTMGRARHLIGQFDRTSKDVAVLEVRSHAAGQWEWSLVYFALAVLPAVTLFVGGGLMGLGATMTIGTLVAMIALQEQLLWPLAEVMAAGVEIQSARALLTRIFEYLDKPVGITESPSAITLDRKTMRGAVQLKDVSFSYDKSDEATISNVSVDIRAGSHLAIVGPTGSGKTTLAYLLSRLYDVDSGSITYDGVDVRDFSFASLTDMLGVVTQDAYLLNASIADNLRFAKPDASDADLVAAARIAQLDDLLASLPNGYDTLVGERGHRFSGGEKQRIALARTVLRNPPVLLLDEATSALDTRTERLLAEALDALARSRTTITIAHRLSTVRNADEIIVLDNGRIVERGNHDRLMSCSGLYAELIASMS
jgi:ATP-binding cassette subfamily B protein